MKRDLAPWAIMFAAAFTAACLIFGAGCASNRYDGVRRGMTASAQLVTTAAQAFGDFDLAHQEALIKGRPADEARTAVAAWRAQRVAIVKGFADAGAVVALGIATVNAVEAGAKGGGDLAVITVQIFAVLQQLWDALKTAGVTLPQQQTLPAPLGAAPMEGVR